jgi:hypothetical protein
VRRILSWWQLWPGVAISAALFVPNLVWQWQRGWPFFEVILPHLDSQRNFTGPFWLFEWRHAMSMNLLLAPLCVAGMLGPFVDRRLADTRFLSLGFVLATRFIFCSVAPIIILFVSSLSDLSDDVRRLLHHLPGAQCLGRARLDCRGDCRQRILGTDSAPHPRAGAASELHGSGRH